jgi:hypothetical protein
MLNNGYWPWWNQNAYGSAWNNDNRWNQNSDYPNNWWSQNSNTWWNMWNGNFDNQWNTDYNFWNNRWNWNPNNQWNIDDNDRWNWNDNWNNFDWNDNELSNYPFAFAHDGKDTTEEGTVSENSKASDGSRTKRSTEKQEDEGQTEDKVSRWRMPGNQAWNDWKMFPIGVNPGYWRREGNRNYNRFWPTQFHRPNYYFQPPWNQNQFFSQWFPNMRESWYPYEYPKYGNWNPYNQWRQNFNWSPDQNSFWNWRDGRSQDENVDNWSNANTFYNENVDESIYDPLSSFYFFKKDPTVEGAEDKQLDRSMGDVSGKEAPVPADKEAGGEEKRSKRSVASDLAGILSNKAGRRATGHKKQKIQLVKAGVHVTKREAAPLKVKQFSPEVARRLQTRLLSKRSPTASDNSKLAEDSKVSDTKTDKASIDPKTARASAPAQNQRFPNQPGFSPHNPTFQNPGLPQGNPGQNWNRGGGQGQNWNAGSGQGQNWNAGLGQGQGQNWNAGGDQGLNQFGNGRTLQPGVQGNQNWFGQGMGPSSSPPPMSGWSTLGE